MANDFFDVNTSTRNSYEMAKQAVAGLLKPFRDYLDERKSLYDLAKTRLCDLHELELAMLKFIFCYDAVKRAMPMLKVALDTARALGVPSAFDDFSDYFFEVTDTEFFNGKTRFYRLYPHQNPEDFLTACNCDLQLILGL